MFAVQPSFGLTQLNLEPWGTRSSGLEIHHDANSVLWRLAPFRLRRLRGGLGRVIGAKDDSDFDPVRAEPAFKQLVG